MKPETIITVLLGLASSSFALELSRLFWNQSPTTPEDARVIEIVRWRQPICVAPDEGVLPCSHTLRKFQTEYERFNGKTLDERRGERSRIDLEPSIASMDEESTIELITPGVVAPVPVNNSPGVSEGFSEGNISELHLKTSEVVEDEEKSIRIDRRFGPGGVSIDEEVRIELAPSEVEAPSNPRSSNVSVGFSAESTSEFLMRTEEGASSSIDEATLDLLPPEAKAPSSPRSPEVSAGFSAENSSQFHLKTPELTQDQGKNIRADRRFASGSSSSKLQKIYVTKVLESPMTATLVAKNCLPDIGVPFCEDYQDYIEPAKPYVDPKPTLTISAEIESADRRQRHVRDSYTRGDTVRGFFVGPSPQKFVIIDFNSTRSPVKLQDGDDEAADRSAGVRSVYYTIKNPSRSKDSELATDLSKKTEGNVTLSSRVPDGSESNNSDIADSWSIGDEEEPSRVPIRVPRYEGPDVPALSGLFEGLEDGDHKESLRKPMGKEFPEDDSSGMGDTRFGTVEEKFGKDYVGKSEYTEPDVPALASLFEGLEDDDQEKSLGKPMIKLEDFENSSNVDRNRGNTLVDLPEDQVSNVSALSSLSEGLEDNHQESLKKPIAELTSSESSGANLTDNHSNTVEGESLRVPVEEMKTSTMTKIPSHDNTSHVEQKLSDPVRQISLAEPGGTLGAPESNRSFITNNLNSTVEEESSKIPEEEMKKTSTMISSQNNTSNDGLTIPGLLNIEQKLPDPAKSLEISETNASTMANNPNRTVEEEPIKAPMEEMKTSTMMKIPSHDNTSHVEQKLSDPVRQKSLTKPGGTLGAPESNRSVITNNLNSTVEEESSKISSQNNTSNDGLRIPGQLNIQQKLPDPAKSLETSETNASTNNPNRTVEEEPMKAPVEEMKKVNNSFVQKIPDTVSLEPSTKPSESSEGSSNSSVSQEKDQKISQVSHENATKTETSTTTPQTPSQKSPHKYGQGLNRTSTKTPARTRVIGHRNYRPGHMFHRRKTTSPRLKLKPSSGNSTRVGAARRKYNKSRLGWVKPRQ